MKANTNLYLLSLVLTSRFGIRRREVFSQSVGSIMWTGCFAGHVAKRLPSTASPNPGSNPSLMSIFKATPATFVAFCIQNHVMSYGSCLLENA